MFERLLNIVASMQDSRTALYQASKNGRVAVVQLLLEEHADHTIGNQVCIRHCVSVCEFPVEYCTPKASGYRYIVTLQ